MPEPFEIYVPGSFALYQQVERHAIGKLGSIPAVKVPDDSEDNDDAVAVAVVVVFE